MTSSIAFGLSVAKRGRSSRVGFSPRSGERRRVLICPGYPPRRHPAGTLNSLCIANDLRYVNDMEWLNNGRTLPLVSYLARAGWRALDASAQPGDITHRQLLALTLLKERGDLAQQDITRVFGLDASNVVGLLNEMEERGLILRRRDNADRRRHIVALTDEGALVLDTTFTRLASIEDELLHALSPQERETLHLLLLRVITSR
ncbi:MarR family transcriptional regulator [Mycetocola lacteus]|uniref:MarR family transcriptional regulator n=2 Tax=Mycetocola lacteus TaxID=76637 RepID=A0A3L7AJ22_9MICO|nr:MarR family transcriptional regulator [Mycetocola lacteus]